MMKILPQQVVPTPKDAPDLVSRLITELTAMPVSAAKVGDLVYMNDALFTIHHFSDELIFFTDLTHTKKEHAEGCAYSREDVVHLSAKLVDAKDYLLKILYPNL